MDQLAKEDAEKKALKDELFLASLDRLQDVKSAVMRAPENVKKCMQRNLKVFNEIPETIADDHHRSRLLKENFKEVVRDAYDVKKK